MTAASIGAGAIVSLATSAPKSVKANDLEKPSSKNTEESNISTRKNKFSKTHESLSQTLEIQYFNDYHVRVLKHKKPIKDYGGFCLINSENEIVYWHNLPDNKKGRKNFDEYFEKTNTDKRKYINELFQQLANVDLGPIEEPAIETAYVPKPKDTEEMVLSKLGQPDDKFFLKDETGQPRKDSFFYVYNEPDNQKLLIGFVTHSIDKVTGETIFAVFKSTVISQEAYSQYRQKNAYAGIEQKTN
ncbi:MAG: hypothetical protein ABH830_04465 [Patescibacteria group bacterium]